MTSDLQTYTSSCHCGQVRLQAKLPPLTETHICNCNCSICTKNGYLLVYPKREDVTFLSGEDNLIQYRFASKLKPHMSCKTCGIEHAHGLQGNGRRLGKMPISV